MKARGPFDFVDRFVEDHRGRGLTRIVVRRHVCRVEQCKFHSTRVTNELELAKLLCEDSWAVLDKFNLQATRVTNEPQLAKFCAKSVVLDLCWRFLTTVSPRRSLGHRRLHFVAF